MTHFEYIVVAVSIVLGLGAAQLLGSLRAVFDPERRYWVHALWVIQFLYYHIQFWWAYWDLKEVEWNLGSFIMALLGPGMLYVISTTLVAPGNTRSWEEHFYAVKNWVFTALAISMPWAVSTTWLLIDAPLLHPYRLIQLIPFVVAIVALSTESRRTHTILVAVNLVLGIGGTTLYRLDPSALVVPG